VPLRGLISATTDGAGDPSLAQLLLSAAVGALFALIVSYVVQLKIVPDVAAKTRRLERWENDVNELWSVLNEQLDRAVNRYRTTTDTVRMIEGRRDHPELDPDHVAIQWRRLENGRRDARDAVNEHLDSASVLFNRIRWRDHDAWQRLDSHLHVYSFCVSSYVWAAAGETAEQVDGEAVEAAWVRQEEARKKLLDLVEPVVRSMKPPPSLRRPARPRPEDIVSHATRCPPRQT
jgi:hypothetical protein